LIRHRRFSATSWDQQSHSIFNADFHAQPLKSEPRKHKKRRNKKSWKSNSSFFQSFQFPTAIQIINPPHTHTHQKGGKRSVEAVLGSWQTVEINLSSIYVNVIEMIIAISVYRAATGAFFKPFFAPIGKF
jgi:hypothetical protein